MGRLIVSSQVTVDGVTDQVDQWFAPDWHGARGKADRDQLYAAEALVLGRKNYEGFAAVWPSIEDDVGYADRVNAMPKYVASRTLEGPLEWNAELLQGEVGPAVEELKASTPGTFLSPGLGDFARDLLALGLVDELQLTVNPLTFGAPGEGLNLGNGLRRLSLIGVTSSEDGFVTLLYRP